MFDFVEKLKAKLTKDEVQLFENAEKLLDFSCKNLDKNLYAEYENRSYLTAKYLFELRLDVNTIIAGLLHEIVKFNLTQIDEVEKQTNSEISRLISSLIQVEKIEHKSKEAEAENIRNMFVTMAKDIRVIIVKLAIVKENLENFNLLTKQQQTDLLIEAKDIYSPLSERLGLNNVKGDIEDYVFMYENPVAYKELKEKLSSQFDARNKQIEEIKIELEQMLKDLNISGTVSGRQKRISSIYKKIQNKTQDFNLIYDLVALRIIVESVEQCYMVLGKIHSKFTPISGKFKDYIALPKQNGYQSLHTTVLAENNQPIEFQIRTKEMHEFADFGIASHWVYKEGGKSTNFDKKFTWLRKVMDDNKDLTAEEFVDVLKTDIFSGQIFVQTPKGKIIEFPEGATPIDFAFAVHSGVGEKCVGAKVNGKMVPLNSTLASGDVVEIITSNMAKGPSRDWINFVKSSSTKQKINAYYKREMKEENIKKGKSILEQSAKNKGIALYKLWEDKYLEDVFKRYKLSGIDEMYASIGFGALTSNQVLNKLQDSARRDENFEDEEEVFQEKAVEINYTKKEQDAIMVRGESNMLTRFGKCCNPIPGDEIIGFVSRGRGVTIHRKDCVNVPFLQPERLVKCAWFEDCVTSFSASIRVIALNHTSTLAEISGCLAKLKINVISIMSRLQGKDKIVLDIKVQLSKKEQVPLMLKEIKLLDKVEDAFRSSTF